MKKLVKVETARELEVVEERAVVEPGFRTFLSKIPFLNIFFKVDEINTRAYRRVVREQTGLMNDYRDQAISGGRLTSVGYEIKRERKEQKNKLREAEREEKGQDNKDTIQDLEQKVKIKKLRNQLEKLGVPEEAEPEEDPVSEYREKVQKEVEMERIKKQADNKKFAAGMDADSRRLAEIEKREKEELEKRFSEFCAKKGKEAWELSEDDRDEWGKEKEDIEGRYYTYKDGLVRDDL